MRQFFAWASSLLIALCVAAPLAVAQGYCPANTVGAASAPITTLPYTVGATDFCLLKVFESTSPGVVSLPAPGTAGQFYPNFNVTIFNLGPGAITLTPLANVVGVTPTINASATINLGTGYGITLAIGTDGNWYGNASNVSVPNNVVNYTTVTSVGLFGGATIVPKATVPVYGIGAFGPWGAHWLPQGWIEFTRPDNGQLAFYPFY